MIVMISSIVKVSIYSRVIVLVDLLFCFSVLCVC